MTLDINAMRGKYPLCLASLIPAAEWVVDINAVLTALKQERERGKALLEAAKAVYESMFCDIDEYGKHSGVCYKCEFKVAIAKYEAAERGK